MAPVELGLVVLVVRVAVGVSSCCAVCSFEFAVAVGQCDALVQQEQPANGSVIGDVLEVVERASPPMAAQTKSFR